MSISPPIREIQHFQNLTLKIQGQGHGSRSKSSYSTLPTHIPFVPCQSALPFLGYSHFKIWHWKFKVKVIVEVTTWVQHSVDSSLSFHVNQASHSRVTPISIFSIWCRWATKTLHNYRSRQVHETLNGVNPSSSFRDMRSAKSGPNLWQIWNVFGPWASPYGANGQIIMTVHNYRPRQFHTTLNGENLSSGYRGMGSASLAAACLAAHPPRDDNTPLSRRAEG